MDSVTIHEANTNLPTLPAHVESGEKIVIPQPPKRQFGPLRGIIGVGAAFFDLLPEEDLAAWE